MNDINLNDNQQHNISTDLLKNSIYNLQIDSIKKILNLVNYDDVVNYTITKYDVEYNVLNFILIQLVTDNNFVKKVSFDTLYYYYTYGFDNVPENQIVLDIIYFLCEKYPHLINDYSFHSVFSHSCKQIIKIFKIFYVDKINDKPECCICFSNYDVNLVMFDGTKINEGLIDNVCSCKNKIHLTCLTECYQYFGDVCTICHNSTRSVIDNRNRVFYPHADIYPDPSIVRFTLILKNKNIFVRLEHAILYLCVDRIQELLNVITDDEFLQFIGSKQYYTNFINLNFKLKNTLFSNLSKTLYYDDFLTVENIFVNKHKSIIEK